MRWNLKLRSEVCGLIRSNFRNFSSPVAEIKTQLEKEVPRPPPEPVVTDRSMQMSPRKSIAERIAPATHLASDEMQVALQSDHEKLMLASTKIYDTLDRFIQNFETSEAKNSDQNTEMLFESLQTKLFSSLDKHLHSINISAIAGDEDFKSRNEELEAEVVACRNELEQVLEQLDEKERVVEEKVQELHQAEDIMNGMKEEMVNKDAQLEELAKDIDFAGRAHEQQVRVEVFTFLILKVFL